VMRVSFKRALARLKPRLQVFGRGL